MIASAFIASGYTPIFKKEGNKITFDKDKVSSKNESKFTLLSSTALWKIPFDGNTIKKTLEIFNKRPDNIYGENVRFIILDSGFKEGIDLFDVKYCHLFEELETEADKTQAVGRELRYCGQKGLPYKNWNLEVITYKLKDIKNNKLSDTNNSDEIEKLIKENALDFLLN